MGTPVEGGDLITLVEIDQDQCSLTYGVGDCAAILGTTGQHKCYNTRKTCQDPDNYDRDTITLTFCQPIDIDTGDTYSIPVLSGTSTSPSRLNTSSRIRNEPLGIRASATATFTDAPHTDRYVDKYAEERISGAAQADGIGYNPLDRGTFWGKWRARNPYWLGRSMRIRQGVIERGEFDQLTERHYIIETFTGPDANGRVSIVGKDVLKLADNDRAQCPRASTGELDAAITDTDTSATLAPSGIGDLEYPASGKITIGAEVMDFTRVSDTLTITRGANNTEAVEHDEGDTVQLSVVYSGETVDDIVYDLLTTYAEVDPSFINTANWAAEVALYIPNGYSAIIPKPTSVRNLIGELSEQAGFSIWWDEINQRIKLSAVKQPGITSLTITDDWMLDGSLRIKDRPDARLSEVWTNYGIIDPTSALDNPNNFRATLVTLDADAESANEYGQDAVRKINSRWITVAGKGAALDLNDRLLSRYRDIIRELSFELPSYRADQIRMGDTHQLQSRYITDDLGDPLLMDIRIMAIAQKGDTLTIDAEELLFKQPPNETTQRVIIGGDINSVNFRDVYDDQFPLGPTGVNDIQLIVDEGVVVGADDSTGPSIDVGTWGDYTYNSLTIINYGRIIGAGGGAVDGGGGLDGGTGLYTRVAFDFDNQGEVAGGGGAGETVASFIGFLNRYSAGGGGGAGRTAGVGIIGFEANDPAFTATDDGKNGTLDAGGAGGTKAERGLYGGAGGDLATAGGSGSGGDPLLNTAPGAAGVAIDGDSYITYTTTGTITGAQVN